MTGLFLLSRLDGHKRPLLTSSCFETLPGEGILSILQILVTAEPVNSAPQAGILVVEFGEQPVLAELRGAESWRGHRQVTCPCGKPRHGHDIALKCRPLPAQDASRNQTETCRIRTVNCIQVRQWDNLNRTTNQLGSP